MNIPKNKFIPIMLAENIEAIEWLILKIIISLIIKIQFSMKISLDFFLCKLKRKLSPNEIFFAIII